jgi:hypothetical protein
MVMVGLSAIAIISQGLYGWLAEYGSRPSASRQPPGGAGTDLRWWAAASSRDMAHSLA